MKRNFVVIQILPEAKPSDTTISINESFSFQKNTILVVDDHSINRKLIRSFLEDTGLDIKEAEHGKEAIEFCQQNPPALILIDLRMPILDGYQATELLKSNPATHHIPIISLSTAITKQDEYRMKQTQFDGHLQKPIFKPALLDILSQYLPHKKEKVTLITPPVSILPTVRKVVSAQGIPELIQQLTQLQPQWKMVQDTFILDDIEEFASHLKRLGERHHVLELIEYSETLSMQVRQFDMEQLPRTLSHYTDMIQQIEKLEHDTKSIAN